MSAAFILYELYGDKGYIGEEVTQLQHAVQAAKQAEEFCNENTDSITTDERKAIIMGAFFHDIGHLLYYAEPDKIPLMGDVGVFEHEIYGANFLRGLNFPDLTCEIVLNHIRTKRYLITKNPEYHNKLSDASKETFKYQGGMMSEDEILDFEVDPNFKYHLKMREWDDKAKLTDPTILSDTYNYFNRLKIEII